MTDNEIIQALEFCIDPANAVVCKGCPYYNTDCGIRLKKDAFDLINRQRAEIDELQHKYDLAVAEREANVKGFTETLERQRAEIERKDRILESYALQYGTVADKDVLLKRAERLCEGRVSNDPVVIAVKAELETVGEQRKGDEKNA